jgi:PhnB protein
MPVKGQPIPPGHHTLTPHLTVRDAARAIEFYKQAFGAKELFRSPGPDGKSIMHAQLQIGDSMIMLNDEFPGMSCLSPQHFKGSPVTIHLFVPNADETFDRAVRAGAQVTMPITDMFWGDRYGRVRDPFGHEWSIATHQYDLTPEELQQAAAAAFSQMKP